MTRRFDSTLQRLLAATLPAHERAPGDRIGLGPSERRRNRGLGELDLREFWRRFDSKAPRALKVGLPAAVLVLSLSVPLLIGRIATIEQLSDDELDTLLNRANESRSFAIRQMVATLKIVACLAYFNDDGVQRETRSDPGGARVSATATVEVSS